MYTKYFGFNEKPFTLTPNPRFIYLSKHHKEAFAHLLYGINNHYGFIELIGEVGTGKTTVLRTLLSQLQDANYRSALIFNPCLSGVELLRSINHEFGVPSDSEYANELLADLNRFLLSENAQGRTVVLVIDEAQNLQPDVLEQIRLISNLETEDDKLIQIILAGQPELEALLGRPELRQLNQRIAVRYRLRPMSMDETRSYIRHRMEIAGETGGVSFGLYAIKWIYLFTRGVPRMINILCDRSLLIAYGDERRTISIGIVTRAIREILNRPRDRRALQLFRGGAVVAAIVAVILVIMGIRWLPERMHQVPASANVRIQEQGPGKLEQEILSYDQNDTHIHAFNAIITRWGENPLKAFNGKMTVPEMAGNLAARRNLRLTTFNGALDDAIRFNIPFLAVTKVSRGGRNFCLAVTSVKDDVVSISPSLFGSNTIRKNDLESISNGTFHLIWQNFGAVPIAIAQEERRHEIKALQQLLKRAGFYRDAIDGIYSSVTTKAVLEFQHSIGIPSNDKVGELTLAALTKYETTHAVPYLKEN